jgi:hypothetical protein
MSLIPFPNIPALPGVPPIPRIGGDSSTVITVVLNSLQSALQEVFKNGILWGIFTSDGTPLADPVRFNDLPFILQTNAILSTHSVDYSKESRVSNFPIEGGSFSSFNKVEIPSTSTVKLCFNGSDVEKRNLLDAIDAAYKSTDSYNVVTPEITYINYSVERYNYSRKSDATANMLEIELGLKEIRTVSAAFTTSQSSSLINSPQSDSAVPTVNAGIVQPRAPQKSTLLRIAEKIPSLGG